MISEGVNEFYVGTHGAFDAMAISVLKELKKEHPHIRFAAVLSYLSAKAMTNGVDTLYPEGLEHTPPRFAISARNNWMLNQSDYVVCYIKHPWGGAAQFVSRARNKHKTVLNLADE